MRNLFIIFGAMIVILWAVTGVDAVEPNDNSLLNWSSGTAYSLPAGRIEVGMFQPLRYGLSESLEMSIHPLVGILMPNFSLKWSHNRFGGFTFATRHSLTYPTFLLRTISKEGIGGMISPEFEIPHMLSLYNEVLLSKQIAGGHFFTGKAGINLAIKSGTLDERTTIDLPLVFPRLAVFYHGYNFRVGGDLQGKLIQSWNYLVDADVFLTPNAQENFAFEHKGLFLWNKSHRFQLCIGYKLTYGEYPFGTQWHLLIPLFDFQWALQLK